MEATPEQLTALESRLGYAFAEPYLLQTALTHPSFRHEHPGMQTDNQRLEFLGDAVLGLLLAEQLFLERPNADEGALTVLRSRCANGSSYPTAQVAALSRTPSTLVDLCPALRCSTCSFTKR